MHSSSARSSSLSSTRGLGLAIMLLTRAPNAENLAGADVLSRFTAQRWLSISLGLEATSAMESALKPSLPET